MRRPQGAGSGDMYFSTLCSGHGGVVGGVGGIAGVATQGRDEFRVGRQASASAASAADVPAQEEADDDGHEAEATQPGNDADHHAAQAVAVRVRRTTATAASSAAARVGREREMDVELAGEMRVEAVDVDHPRVAERRSDIHTVAEHRWVASKLPPAGRKHAARRRRRAADPNAQRVGLEKPVFVVQVDAGLDSVVVGVLAKRKAGRRPRRLFAHRDVYAICAQPTTPSGSAAQQGGFTNPLTPLMRLCARPAHRKRKHNNTRQTHVRKCTHARRCPGHDAARMLKLHCTSKRPTPSVRNSCVRGFVLCFFYAHLVLCATSRGTFLCSIGMLGISYSLFRNSVGPHKRPFSSCLMYFFLCALGKADKIALRYQLGCVCSGHSCVLWP